MELTANIVNLGKYNSGYLAEVRLSFPTTTEQVQAALRSIGVDGLRYEEIRITEYFTDIPGLSNLLGEYAHIDELNYLAHCLSELSPNGLDKFAAALRHGEYGGSMKDLINLTRNLACYDMIPQVKTYEDYGRHLVDTKREFYIPQKARYYFDYESYGEDTAINEGGDLTPWGYIFNNRRVPFKEIYDGTVPDQYKVFQYPMEQRAKAARTERNRDSPAYKHQ
jgi:hypothetical protein